MKYLPLIKYQSIDRLSNCQPTNNMSAMLPGCILLYFSAWCRNHFFNSNQI